MKPFCFVGRVYLGMHSPIDIMGGLVFGLIILAFWLRVHNHVDVFIVGGQNGTIMTYSVTLKSLLMLHISSHYCYMQMSSQYSIMNMTFYLH